MIALAACASTAENISVAVIGVAAIIAIAYMVTKSIK